MGAIGAVMSLFGNVALGVLLDKIGRKLTLIIGVLVHILSKMNN